MGAMSSLRMPQSLAKRLGVETGEAVLRYELVQEQAASLGRVGRKAEAALAALRDHPGGEGRAQALAAAADAVWCFFVQREVMGLRDRAQVIRDYEIPREVLNRIGAR
jgi:antitoxin component of MazEF toxin-antitoxin module